MNKYNKPKLLPLVEDVVKISKYIDRRWKELELTSDCYRGYCQVILAQIIHFNRKRGGEAEWMTLKNFQDAQCGGVVDRVVLALLQNLKRIYAKPI